MAQTDRQTDKSSRWAFTAYEGQWSLFGSMIPGIAEWGWQTEKCPETNRLHYQGFLRTTAQQRLSWFKKNLPGVHVEIAKNWEGLKNYCQKPETRTDDSRQIHQVTSYMTLYQYTDDVAKRVADLIKATGQTINQIPKAQRLVYVDTLVRQDICEGRRYASDIAINPQWVSKWNKYSFELIFSFMSIDASQISQQEDSVTPQNGEASQDPDQEGRDGQVD